MSGAVSEWKCANAKEAAAASTAALNETASVANTLAWTLGLMRDQVGDKVRAPQQWSEWMPGFSSASHSLRHDMAAGSAA